MCSLLRSRFAKARARFSSVHLYTSVFLLDIYYTFVVMSMFLLWFWILYFLVYQTVDIFVILSSPTAKYQIFVLCLFVSVRGGRYVTRYLKTSVMHYMMCYKGFLTNWPQKTCFWIMKIILRIKLNENFVLWIRVLKTLMILIIHQKSGFSISVLISLNIIKCTAWSFAL